MPGQPVPYFSEMAIGRLTLSVKIAPLCATLQSHGCILPGSSVMEFSRQEYWSGLPFPSPGDLPDPWIEPRSPALQVDHTYISIPHVNLPYAFLSMIMSHAYVQISAFAPNFNSLLLYLFSSFISLRLGAITI